MQVILLPEVLEYLEDLSEVLYEKGYFSFEDTASEYVLELYDDIVLTLPTRHHKPAPLHFDRYGEDMDYAVFRKNKNTSWYVFFTSYEVENRVIYLVRHIANNHTVAQYL
ncbi:MAG: hypothetical protein LBH22_02010 [Bacteroidales bacterium]|jgi:hypothetical protein|nr:hypothetical protein [Bacteroidales bacterium]